MNPNRMDSVEGARQLAARVLPRVLFDYVDGGADDELTMAANREAFRQVELVPRMASGVTDPRCGVDLFGTSLDLPVVLAPCGLVTALHPDGPVGVARAAASRGTLSVLSAVAGRSPEAVADGCESGGAAVGAPRWFQLYAPGGRREWEGLVDRAAASGYQALVVTVDTPALGNRERDRRNGFSARMELDPRAIGRLAAQVASRPGWAARMGASVVSDRRHQVRSGPTVGLVAAGGSPFSWDDVGAIRERWKGPLLAKGVLSGTDSMQAVERGCDGVIVSNHGGRQLDGAPPTMRALPEVVDAVGSSSVVLVDGGVRRGSDVVKALATGADAVLIGRPYLYGLAVAGRPGVERVIDILRNDLERTLVLAGCGDVADLDRSWIREAR